MVDMLSFDRGQENANQYEYLDANMHPTNNKKAKSQTRSVKGPPAVYNSRQEPRSY